jgi:DNA polymerase-3 subunit delta
MNPAALRTQLEAGELRGAYLVVGEEALLRDDAVAAIREAALGDGPAAFDFERLEGERARAGELLDAVRTLPVAAAHRVVVLREPEAARGGREALGDAIAEAVAELGGASPPLTLLVVVAARVDRRARWVRAFGANACVECDAPRGGRELLAFARAEAKRQQVAFERGALERLVERCGAQLLALRQEIAKAGLLAGPGQRVSRAHVEAGAIDLAEESIWELGDAVAEGRGADALVSLARLLVHGAAPQALLGSLAAHARRLLRVRHGERVPGPPFVQRRLESQAERASPAQLLARLRAIHEADTALKGEGGVDPELALERLVMRIAR